MRKRSAETELRDTKRLLNEERCNADSRLTQLVSLKRDIAERDQRINDMKNTIAALTDHVNTLKSIKGC